VGNINVIPAFNSKGRDPRNYPFTVITLNLDENGNGDGTYTRQAQLRFNKKHQLEIEDYVVEPARVVKVHMEEISK
jgi:hypothetical protein